MSNNGASAARYAPAPAGSQAVDAYLQIDMPRLFYWLRKGSLWIILFTLVGLIAGIAYARLSTPRYTVTTDILVDPAGLQIVSDDLFRRNDQQQQALLLNVESKRQTLLSRTVLLRAIDALDLQTDPEFVPPPPTGLFALLGSPRVAQGPEVAALDSLQKRLSAQRDEASFVITMSVWSRDPQKSIRISEAIIAAFREELIAADAEGAKRSAGTLTGRIKTLKDDVNAADEAVEAFRRERRLQTSEGELVSSRSMTQVNQQLVEARQRLIAAESRYNELSGEKGADAAAMLSTTIPTLRAQYSTLKSAISSQAQIYGPRHPRVVQQSSALSSIQNEIDAEIRRVQLSARNELDQARATVAALQAEAATAGVGVFSDNDAQIRLRELTREAAAKAAIYEAFLLRAHEITQSEQIDSTNIRIISPPVLPRTRSWPPTTAQVGGFGAMTGMVLSMIGVLGFGIARDMGNGAGQPAPQLAPNPARRRRPEVEGARPSLRVPAAFFEQRGNRNISLLNLWPDEQRLDDDPDGRRSGTPVQ